MKWGFLALLLLIAGCEAIQKPSYELSFAVLESGKPLDGNVYLNGRFLGRTEDGNLGVLLQNMSEGALQFTGYYQGRPFNYSYSISTDNLNHRSLSFTVERDALERFTMVFAVRDTNETIDGIVINNDRELGKTLQGRLSVPARDVEEGRIIIKGTLRGKPFEFKFAITEENVESSRMNFVITQQDLERAVFNAADVDRIKLEQQVVRLVNDERKKVGTPELKWNAMAASVAYEHSKDMARREYFAHQNPDGENVGERLKEVGIFYTVAAEDLSLFENVRPDTNISERAVAGWMNSPGHRAPIVDADHLFSDAGAGVHCESKTCYITLVFLGNERRTEPELPSQYLSFYYLYDPSYGFTMDVPVKFRLESDQQISAYLVPGRESYEDLLKGQETDYIKKYEDTQVVEDELLISPNMGLVLENRGESSAKMELHIDYYP